jgi:hypothetical protein
MRVWTRLWFVLLAVTDRLLGTRLVERKMTRLQRWIEEYEAHAVAIQRQQKELERLLHVTQVSLCILYLYQRRLFRPETWLRFAPAEGADEEEGLDMLIEQLVKHDLAAVRVETVGEQTYVYFLHPDWSAIKDLLGDRKEHLDPTMASWLEEKGPGN